tara:strand:+ start:227 stop:502 length:276 start_codon:yes stop_codon:yes gene_type:complete
MNSDDADLFSPMQTINDFETGIDKIIFYHKQSDNSEQKVIREDSGDLRWKYFDGGQSTNIDHNERYLRLGLNGAEWQESDIEFVSFDPVII